MLSLLMLVGFVGCVASVDKTPSIIQDLSELDLSDTAAEALAIGATNGTSAFTYVGLALFAIGAVSFAFLARDAGLKLMACGALAGAIPFVVESAYFSIIVSGALLLSLLIAIYHLWWKVRQNQNAEEEQKP
jgi:predicted aconitase with swiveling domain